MVSLYIVYRGGNCMGGSLNNDKNLRVYLTLAKRVYIAGEYVEGTVHIDCHMDRPYRSLMIRLEGREEVFWKKHRGKVMVIYNNKRETYLQDLLVTQFPNGMIQGQYNYPFSILLPSTLPSSVHIDDYNQIRYQLSAFLPSFDKQSDQQMFKRSLHVREPPRGVLQMLKGQNNGESKCCGCCCSDGFTNLSIEANVNFIQVNKPFLVKGKIDNSLGKAAVKSYAIVLCQRQKRISNSQYVMNLQENYVLHNFQKCIKSGHQESFQCQVSVPPTFKGYTAIGNILYRTYYLSLVAEMGCCYSNPRVLVHTIVNTTLQPQLQVGQIVQFPVGWNPAVAVPVSAVNLKPYLYMPSRMIDVRNQEGRVILNQMQALMSGPVIQNQIGGNSVTDLPMSHQQL